MAPLPPDPYKILGVSRDAQTPEIRSCYRKLVLTCHPDKVQDPTLKEEKQNLFQRVQQAYELLTNDAERQKYDDKVKLEHLRRQMKEKAHVSTPPKPSAKYSTEFEFRTPDTRSSSFKSPPTTTFSKVYTFTRIVEDDYAGRGARVFETKTSRSSKRDATYSEKHSKRDLEREKERGKDKDRQRDRRRKDDDAARRAASKLEKEANRAEKKRQEKQRDREYKREAEEKHRQRYAKPTADSYDDEPPLKSDRKRSSNKYDDKSGRSPPPPRDEMPDPSTSRPPLRNRFYSSVDDPRLEHAASYIQATRVYPGSGPGLYRSASYSTHSAYPPVPSPPPTTSKKAAFVSDETDSDDNVGRSPASSRRGSGDGARQSRERSSYRRSSDQVKQDDIPATPSPAARQATAFGGNWSAKPTPMAASPPRRDLPRTNTMPPQPSFSRPSPRISRAQTFNAFGGEAAAIPRGRGRSRMQAQMEYSDSDDEYERREERDHKYRSSRRMHSPEPMAARESMARYHMDGGGGRPRRLHGDSDTGHAYYAHAYRMSETRVPASYREPSYGGISPGSRLGNVKTSKYEDIRYSDYGYHNAVRV